MGALQEDLRWLLKEAALYLVEGDHFGGMVMVARRLAMLKLWN